MPMYEYVCQRCDRKFEELVRNKQDEDDLKCPDCGCIKVDKQFSTFGFLGGSSAESDYSGSSGGGCRSCSSSSCASCSH